MVSFLISYFGLQIVILISLKIATKISYKKMLKKLLLFLILISIFKDTKFHERELISGHFHLHEIDQTFSKMNSDVTFKT